MTYISGQPIVFVGTGQTYPDLKSLDAKVYTKITNNIINFSPKLFILQAVVAALMK